MIARLMQHEHLGLCADGLSALQERFAKLKTTLTEFEKTVSLELAPAFAAHAHRLDEALMLRTSRLEVNFSADLSRIIREAGAFVKLGISLTPALQNVHQRSRMLRLHAEMLQVVASKYNKAQSTLSKAERPLVQLYIDDIDEQLQPTLDPYGMSWNQPSSIEILHVLLVCTRVHKHKREL